MKNTIIFDNKIDFKQGETLTFFLNENFDFRVEGTIFSPQTLNKIQVYLKSLKFKKIKEKIIGFDISEKNKVLFIVVKENLVSNNFEELGANLYSFIKTNKIDKVNLYADTIKSFKPYKKIGPSVAKHTLNILTYNPLHPLICLAYLHGKLFLGSVLPADI